MKVIGIILLVLQAVSIYGSFVNGSIAYLFNNNIFYLIGYFLPTIIGVILLTKAKKKSDK